MARNGPSVLPEQTKAEARTEQLTNRLLEAATKLFMEKGFKATSMVEIARHAHASKETFYRYFPSKEDLFREVVYSRVNLFVEEMSKVLVSHDPPAKALTLFGELVLGRILTVEATSLHRILSLERERFPELSGVFHEKGPARVHAALSRYLGEQVAKGTLRKMSPAIAARQFFDLVAAEMLMRINIAGRPHPTKAQVQQRVREAVDCFLHGYVI
jgi:AcrR family transcriptional regulator